MEDFQEKIVYAKVLGSFSVEYNYVVLNYLELHSELMVRLLAYLIIHHKQNIPVDTLCELIWLGEAKDNPLGALKNLVYRLRKKLRASFGDEEFIVSGAGCYGWNSRLPLRVDLEEFERLYTMGKDLEALFLYQGEVLKGIVQDYWAMSYAMYYHSLFLGIAKRVTRQMEEEHCYQMAERICMKALSIDMLDEEMHSIAFEILCKQGKWKKAKEYQEKVVGIFKTELGIEWVPEYEGNNYGKNISK